MTDNLMNAAEQLKDVLVQMATGQAPDEDKYKRLRQVLITHPRTRNVLPHFVFECRTLLEFWDFIKPKSGTYAERRTYLRTEFAPLLDLLEGGLGTPLDGPFSEAAQAMDSESVHECWQKALERRATDPEGAITASRALVEAVCKHILDDAGAIQDGDASLPALYKLTATHLNLSPGQHSETVFKQILGGCTSVVEGLGALRNRHGDAHGRGAQAAKPASRHAELAVNLAGAGAMALFLLQTWEARSRRSDAIWPGATNSRKRVRVDRCR